MKLCLDARHSPSPILTGHFSNQVANLLVNPGTSDPARSGLPAPVTLKALPVPLNHRFWFHDHKDRAPVSPSMGQGDPEQAISVTKPRWLSRPAQDQQLLTQCEVFSDQHQSRDKQTAE